MPIQKRYQELLKQSVLEPDAAQLKAIEHLGKLEQQFDTHSSYRETCAPNTTLSAKGLYIWGDVGRGKTLLMDLFYNELQTQRKLRMHFHRFMKRIHSDLFGLSGTRNPLEQVANQLANETDILCFDEFFISDIADAMILGHLTKALFERNVIFVTTSNQHPDQLYADGVQRDRFLPAIQQLKNNNHIFNLNGDKDYRLNARTLKPVYLIGSELNTEPQLHKHYQQLTANPAPLTQSLLIEGRIIVCKGNDKGTAWFDFSALCEDPRSQNDYIHLAKSFHTIIISNIPQLGGGHQLQKIARGTEDVISNPTGNRKLFSDDRTRRFITLIDELYDHSVNIIASLSRPLTSLYQSGHLEFEFRRTQSRLMEMQGSDYINQPHRPD